MNKITWGDLLKFIQEHVTDLDSCAMILNAETGDEYPSSFWIEIDHIDDRKNGRCFITFNHERWHNE